MRIGKQLRSVAACGVLMGGAFALSDCQAAQDAAKGCDGLDVATSKFDATVKAFSGAVNDLNTAVVALETKWFNICMAVDTELKLDTSTVVATDSLDNRTKAACSIMQARIKSALDKGVTVTLDVQGQCTADASVEASCQADCAASAKCDIAASCEAGKLVVDCNGACDAECTWTDPSIACSGSCEGECDASVAVSCAGTCNGKCDAPTWSGTCDAGCSATFSGSCGGNCNGTCDGTATTGSADGNCAGKCDGTCSAKASGSCKAACTGNFSGGNCSGQCTGGCTSTGSATCSGTCKGTCHVSGGASCKGECHGHCSAQVSPPRCEGHLNCDVDAHCQASCQSQASAHLDCQATANWVVIGDGALYTALVHESADIGVAFKQTLALKDPILNVFASLGNTIQAAGSLTAAGGVCFATAFAGSASITASFNVSVSASAQVQGQAG